jgi:hypothetical protein
MIIVFTVVPLTIWHKVPLDKIDKIEAILFGLGTELNLFYV